MPQYGWEPCILTVDPENATYPAIDPSLEKDVPDTVKVFRTRSTDWFRFYRTDKSKVPSGGFASNKDDSFKGKISRFLRGNFFIPDPRKGWNRHALKKAIELIDIEKINHIITTSPPHSTQLIGLKLAKKYPGIRWIADLRDPWTNIYYYDLFYPSRIARRLDLAYEKAVLENASIITTVGPSLGKLFESKIPHLKEKIKVIHNGYDEADFVNEESLNPQQFIISYTGTLSESYPVEGFIRAIQKVLSEGQKVSVKFTGHISDTLKGCFISAIGKENLEFNPYADHKTVIKQMLLSSMQLLVLAKDPQNRSFLPGKLFEYIASGKPILCLGPVDGDSAQILENGGYGKCFDYNDAGSMAEYILSSIKSGIQAVKSPPAEFSRNALTLKLVGLLE